MTFNINNVSSFRGFEVCSGEIYVADSQYVDYLDELYPDNVIVCGKSMSQSTVLQECEPIAFRCGKGDYESELQSELDEAINNEDDSEIEWEEGKEPVEEDEE